MEWMLFSLFLILITVFLSVMFAFYKDNLKLRDVNKELRERTLEYMLKCQNLEYKFQRTIIHNENAKQEHELQGEFEADDDTYNKIVSDWIYGAAEDKEGGIDG